MSKMERAKSVSGGRSDGERRKKKRRTHDESRDSASPSKKPRNGVPDPAKSDKVDSSKSEEEHQAKKERKRLHKLKAAQVAPPPTGDVVDGNPLSPALSTKETMPYQQNAELGALPQAELDKYLSSNSITLSNPVAPDLRPITTFDHLPDIAFSQAEVFHAFKAPTPIQACAWPYAFAGRDVIGVAETGSGKTLAFGLPCARRLAAQTTGERKGKIRGLVVSPTRELALQIHDHFSKLADVKGMKSACVYGGVPKDEQRKSLAKANVVIATPGRLKDFVEEGAIDLSHVIYAVLDEADRMLDKGFEDDIKFILSQVPTPRQVLMFTATWPQSIRELASTFMNNPVRISIGGSPSGDLRASANIKQLVEIVDPRSKQARLLQLLEKHTKGHKKDDRILVFCLYKKEASRIESFIRSKGFRAAGIHGDMAQAARERSLDGFKSGKVPVLVATDVAARGIDIPSVSLVINNTFPLTAEDYVHRIGRTGRAGQKGVAITLFTEQDKALSGALINVLKSTKQEVPEALLAFGGTVKKKQHDVYGAFFRETDDGAKATKITFD